MHLSACGGRVKIKARVARQARAGNRCVMVLRGPIGECRGRAPRRSRPWHVGGARIAGAGAGGDLTVTWPAAPSRRSTTSRNQRSEAAQAAAASQLLGKSWHCRRYQRRTFLKPLKFDCEPTSDGVVKYICGESFAPYHLFRARPVTQIYAV